MSQKYCHHCGNEIIKPSKFCGQCGATLEQLLNQTNEDVNQVGSQMTSTQSFWKRYKWIMIGLTAVIIGFMLYNKQDDLPGVIANDSPEKVATEFVKHITTLEIEKAYNLMAVDGDPDLHYEIEEAKRAMNEDEMAFREEMRNVRMDGYIFESFEVQDKEYYGKNNVVIDGDLYLRNGEIENLVVELVKERGKWKVAEVY